MCIETHLNRLSFSYWSWIFDPLKQIYVLYADLTLQWVNYPWKPLIMTANTKKKGSKSQTSCSHVEVSGHWCWLRLHAASQHSPGQWRIEGLLCWLHPGPAPPTHWTCSRRENNRELVSWRRTPGWESSRGQVFPVPAVLCSAVTHLEEKQTVLIF